MTKYQEAIDAVDEAYRQRLKYPNDPEVIRQHRKAIEIRNRAFHEREKEDEA